MSLSKIQKTFEGKPFRPPLLLQSPILQIAAFFASPYYRFSTIPKIRKIIPVAHDTKLIADCWFQKDNDTNTTVVVLNGFEGYSKSDNTRFGRGVAHKAYGSGFNVILLRQRGEGESITLTKSPADFLVEDLPIALKEIKGWNSGNLYVVGFSLGGWASFMAAKKLQDQNILAGIVGVSVPVSTMLVWEHIEKSKLFDAMLLRRYKSLIARRVAIDPPGTWDSKQLKAVKTKQQFFETYKHLLGYPQNFSSLDEFFTYVDISTVLARIKIPTLIIHALDDPAIPARPFLEPDIVHNPSIVRLLPKHGSHGCFIGRKVLPGDVDRHWAQNRALEFIRFLEQKENN